MKYSTIARLTLVAPLCAAHLIAQAQPTPSAPVMSGAAPSAAAATTLQSGPAGIARASQILGKPVTDASGSTIGRVTNLASAGGGGLIVVLEKSGGGFVGLPLSELKVGGGAASGAMGPGAMPGAPAATLGVDKLVFTGGKDGLGAAPTLENPTRIDAIWLDSYHQAFPSSLAGTGAPGAAGRPTQPPAGAGLPGADTGNRIAAETAAPMFLGSVITSGIEDGTGQPLGAVEDIAISMPDGTIAFAVVSTPGSGPGGAKVLHGVAMESLQPGAQGTFMLPGPQPDLGAAPGLDLDRLPASPDVRITRDATPGQMQPGSNPQGQQNPPAPGTQPGGKQPSGTQPGGTQPGGTQPGGSKPGGDSGSKPGSSGGPKG